MLNSPYAHRVASALRPIRRRLEQRSRPVFRSMEPVRASSPQVALRGGRCVVLQPLGLDATARFRSFLLQLSPESRHQRFHAAINDVPGSLLTALTTADQHRHVAWIAEECARPGTIVAEARYVTAGDEAEIALAVADGYQRQGLGRALLGRLVQHATQAGVHRLWGQVRADNTPMLRLASSAGLSSRPLADDASIVVVETEPGSDGGSGAIDHGPAPAACACNASPPVPDRAAHAPSLRALFAIGLPAIAVILLPGGILVAVLAGLARHWRRRARNLQGN